MSVQNPPEKLSAAAQGWLDFTRALGEAGLRVHELAARSLAKTPQQFGEVNEHMMHVLAAAVLMLPRIDPDCPEWFPALNSTMRCFNGNQDTVYTQTRIRGSGVYRVAGRRGTVKILLLQVFEGSFGFDDTSKVAAEINVDQCKIAPDGSFEIIFSAERPVGYSGDWVQINGKIDNLYLIARQVAEDWKTEIDAQLSVQRIDKDIDQPHWSQGEYDQRLRQIPDYVERFARSFMAIVERQHAQIPINGIKEVTQSLPTIVDQAYGHGIVEIADDEVWIMEAELLNKSAYWGVQIMDALGNTLDFMNHQCGLNAKQGKVDTDGRLRIVISRKDPGVANWIDKADYDRVTVRTRFFDSAFPTTRTKVVPMADLWKHLPSDTPRVSPKERQAALRARVEGAQWRRRW
ncbi:MAG: DUF1214 domain-containing protein [Hyphomonadaceae bacterium]